MASIIFSTIGGAVGASAMGPIGGVIGQMAGAMIGGAIDASFGSPRRIHYQSGSRLSDLLVQGSSYGRVIPVLYGSCRIAGNVIWSLPIVEHEHRDVTEMSGGKGGGGSGAHITNLYYSYSVTLAIAICKGEIDNVANIWADAKLLTPLMSGICRIYKGSEDQLPDPLIEAHLGIGKTPAYRGLCYIVIENFPLGDYGNRIPNFTFEVRRRAKIDHRQPPPVEDMIKSICIIPGSGEFVYDTKLQYKTLGSVFAQGKAQAINQHNFEGKPNALLALDQLQQTCPNVEWVAPVVTWFATSLDIKDCKILPGVEFKDGQSTQPDIWSVGRYNRSNAHQVTLKDGRPIYGGSVADASILRYLDEMRSRGLKIMLYPMIFVDLPDKPWRGHISGKQEFIGHFFDNTEGYIQFIIHYANLAKDKIDAFVIGSELVKLTCYPKTIEKLCGLASQVKQILGPDALVTYAADWSEYHHGEAGWYYLDQLWAHNAIDLIGIDAYFPLTSLKDNNYCEDDIIKGWTKGEGYDDQEPAYAWKNIEWWWNNAHINPDGKKTAWEPRSKKIWFTEFGFPSVDLASNQPNIFYDPNARDGGFPVHSKGRVDFQAQRIAISATIKKWANSEMVERMFLWTWDARPYPYWPNLTEIWADGSLWLRGHWVNGKFGICRLGDIIAECCLESGLNADQFDVSKITDLVDGFVRNYQQPGRAIIENLQEAFFFDVIESGGKLVFSPIHKRQIKHINKRDLIDKIQVTRQQELELLRQYILIYTDRMALYQPSLASTICQTTNSKQQFIFDSRLVLSHAVAEMITQINLYRNHLERTTYQFKLPPRYLALEPGDALKIAGYYIRILAITITTSRIMQIRGVACDSAEYDFYIEPEFAKPATYDFTSFDHIIHIIELPDENAIYIAIANRLGRFAGVNFYYSDDGVSYDYAGNIIDEATIGSLVKMDNNKMIISLVSGRLESVTAQSLARGKNKAMLGNETFQFEYAQQLESHLYELSGICSDFKNRHEQGERFILLNVKLKKIQLPNYLLGVECFYKILAPGQHIDEVMVGQFVWQKDITRSHRCDNAVIVDATTPSSTRRRGSGAIEKTSFCI